MAVQVVEIVKGIKPLRALVRIAEAARPLLSIPLDWLWQRPAQTPDAGASKPAVPVSWQLQRCAAGEIRLLPGRCSFSRACGAQT